ncbi:hypothetical protein ALISP_1082 [Alicycliphilus sp. B1]|nr:hypothetical protein ALISP_1082 [Alicycliphilus sp. B1]
MGAASAPVSTRRARNLGARSDGKPPAWERRSSGAAGSWWANSARISLMPKQPTMGMPSCCALAGRSSSPGTKLACPKKRSALGRQSAGRGAIILSTMSLVPNMWVMACCRSASAACAGWKASCIASLAPAASVAMVAQ